MHQYLIRQFKDSIGYIHTNVEKARSNETLSLVEASSMQEAKTIHEGNTNGISKLLNKLDYYQLPYLLSGDDETLSVEFNSLEIVFNYKDFKVFQYFEHGLCEPEELVLQTTDVNKVIDFIFEGDKQ
ncbi:DUF1381 domain-containing protein [Escherichia coli]|uniref:DUF1381 domain-containing protein n=1 Tax=Escherichia coli TaxID=562 RepID=UPI003F453C7D